MSKNFESVCKKLNKILSERKEGYIHELNKIIDKEVWAEGGELYFDRDVYLSYDCDSEKVRSVVGEKPEHVQFEPSEDPDEHPGITLRYKPYVYDLVRIEWVDFNKVLDENTIKEITDISDSALVLWNNTGDDTNDNKISLLVAHDTENGKVWTIDNCDVCSFFDSAFISKYCPLLIDKCLFLS